MLEPGQTLGGYRIESLIARGGMGVVYRAEQIALERTVALKVIAPEYAQDVSFQARFQREARLAAQLSHPHIVSVHEAGNANGQLFMAMAYVEGDDLGELIAAGGPLTPERASVLFPQIARALDAAHAAGLVHRDIKPGNILVASGRDGEHAYLGDFGLTKDAGSASGVTRTGEWVGTVDYVAPEQIENRPIDARTDIYSLGCLLFHSLAGHAPFAGTDVARMYAHVSTPAPALPGVAPAVDAVAQRAMAKDPEDRFPSAGDLGRALEAAVGGDRLPGTERSVATGPAAAGMATRQSAPPPAAAPAVPATTVDPPPGPYAPPRNAPGRGVGTVLGIAAGVLLALALVGGGIVLATRSSGGDGPAKPVAETTAKASKKQAAQGKPAAGAAPTTPAKISYSKYTPPGYGWTAELPSGNGWSAPQNSEPTPDRRYTTAVRGPGSVTVEIDYTPFDVPDFGDDSLTPRTVPQPEFGNAREYVTTTAKRPLCHIKCVDYLVDDGQGGGYAVIAGGGNFETARTVARHIMSTLTYNDE